MRSRIDYYLFALVPIIAVGLAPLALADVVQPPPKDCLEGTVGESYHGAQVCRPNRCNNGACTEGRVCESRKFCLELVTIYSHGSPMGSVEAVRGVCAQDGTCQTGTCQDSQVCVLPTADASPGNDASPSGDAAASTDGSSGEDASFSPDASPIANTPAGNDDSGCGCRLQGRYAVGGSVLLFLAALAGALLRRGRREG